MEENKKITISQIIWLFVCGCLIGFVIETLWHFIKNGMLINKQGLLYGPFKPIYGTGLVLIVILMQSFKNKKYWWKFITGVLIGSTFEYFCSIFQEVAFGTSTWNYSNFNYNLGGRIYLPYCLAWGFIAVICIDYFYPWFKTTFNKIPIKIEKVITILVGIFMIVNVTLTTLATMRYSERANDIEASNMVLKFIDETYPDEYMQIKFPKLKIIGQ